ncbi:cohesin domain-containing protein [Massilia sp. CCM 8734]|uniref:cohesin domain-containing protein n=1 Tax=Massilia sp. CCM 8734 TaxID=2609283 RepID=UPI001421E81C|nr:cohesin domain-containing protein [Massilia sp. CCM 8734]NHZ99839.1 general secretion pathway protein GspD [Massilia sp. CCM 8734]
MTMKLMQSRPLRRMRSATGTALLGVALCAALLAGCGAARVYGEGTALLAEGKTMQGLAKMEEAVKMDPKNPELRIGLANRRHSLVTALVGAGEGARREGRLSDAEKAYREVQVLEPENAMARQGLESLVTARRHRLVMAEAEELLKQGGTANIADAIEKMRPVLAEGPKQKEAMNLKARLEEARAKDARPDIKLAAAFRQPISLEFRDAPLKSVLEVVAKVSGLNFYYDKDIRPDLKATVFAKNTTTEDAIRLLLVTNQLEQKILNENSLLIYPSTAQKLKEYQTLAVRSFYLTNADVKAVSNSIKTIVKTKDMVVDERLGIIIVRDTPEAIRIAERIVALQDLGDSEVLLDVQVMEVKRSRLMDLGVQWPSQLALSPLQVGSNPLTLDTLRGLNSGNIQATLGNVLIKANKEDQTGNILANPRIRVRNKDKAKIQIGDRVPVITTTSTSTGFVSESVAYVDVGLKLEVEPNIYLDDDVAIKVNLEVSNLVREIVSRSGTLAYQIGSRGASTVLRLKNGETQILAGLISDEDRTTANKVPLVGDLPIAGRLFGSQKDDTQRTEILLSITPHVVRSIGRPDMLDAEFDSGTEASIGTPTLRLATALAEPADKEGAKEAGKGAARDGAREVATVSAGTGAAAGAVAPDSRAGAVGTFSLAWQGPAQVKVGEQFSVVLKLSSEQALRGLPALMGFDPQVFQVANVQEGDFFKQGNGKTSFTQRVDAAQGKAFFALVRQSESGSDNGINGSGALVTVTFKALKAAAATKLQLLSATPEPVSVVPPALPVEHVMRVVP